MSPEQVRGLTGDKRVDIRSFGCVFHEMLTGHMPFAGGTLSDTFVAVLEREPDWRASRRPHPAALRARADHAVADAGVPRSGVSFAGDREGPEPRRPHDPSSWRFEYVR